jgi:hypothetical protein
MALAGTSENSLKRKAASTRAGQSRGLLKAFRPLLKHVTDVSGFAKQQRRTADLERDYRLFRLCTGIQKVKAAPIESREVSDQRPAPRRERPAVYRLKLIADR